jgi:hypothetical protein
MALFAHLPYLIIVYYSLRYSECNGYIFMIKMLVIIESWVLLLFLFQETNKTMKIQFFACRTEEDHANLSHENKFSGRDRNQYFLSRA